MRIDPPRNVAVFLSAECTSSAARDGARSASDALGPRVEAHEAPISRAVFATAATSTHTGRLYSCTDCFAPGVGPVVLSKTRLFASRARRCDRQSSYKRTRYATFAWAEPASRQRSAASPIASSPSARTCQRYRAALLFTLAKAHAHAEKLATAATQAPSPRPLRPAPSRPASARRSTHPSAARTARRIQMSAS